MNLGSCGHAVSCGCGSTHSRAPEAMGPGTRNWPLNRRPGAIAGAAQQLLIKPPTCHPFA